ncbi:16S rRNA (cytosine(1402)-N(4))-methyltransferase RsmH [Aerococcus kribbianus]|uniref:Ribosomal RNA small subunit methyltransferase H n=1 Tax=Aerococcus kribbianus TaxID=2999064 RepID=A0A9X3FVJ0_9LACT|nr:MULTISPECIES: 16S rRNA (cytosine(1402)-N(4))-methyltransferase RsmH [unclassified Aerococcus]MCZ0717716.1 16S rRNA (cytosine(1402)-N(4))-methyltransferase RsmH [Aerococcus sp. YH-aer221]MCZ0726004.1 16S rRNA (cytosine(1402)-N(4))-methyltransferase RsmH [Aerococcus sp. YH-aer222]
MTKEFQHISVLLQESVDGLNIKTDGIYVDCTLGGAGHSKEILKQLSKEGHLYAFDQDQKAINHAESYLADEIVEGRVTLIHNNFRSLEEELAKHHVHSVDGFLYDLGISSPQVDETSRGFSYHQDAPLDMRMDQSQDLTAEIVVNEWSYEDLVRIFFRYGEEKFSKQIARKIEKRRADHRITRTAELVAIIKEAIPAPARRKGGHPAKRVFQAIRIAVNDELTAIEESLDQALALLNEGGRISAISFQSLEDRILKQMFKAVSTPKELPKKLPIPDADLQADYQLITRKPIQASEEELALNPRAQSAKLRIIERNNNSQ